ncbi:MAG TPA: 2-hydroxyacid dehydrogenase, partial [Tahibacter sp.]|nr:2-hydroxyacid dehydrogenase [Tahibacter sp.]
MNRPLVALYDNAPDFVREAAEPFMTLHSAADAEAAPQGIRGVLSCSPRRRLDANVLGRFPDLEIVAHHGVGYDAVDVNWCAAHGVIVTHTPGVLDAEVADLALGLLLATVRQIPQADRYLRNGQWAAAPYPLTTSLQGREVGIFGLGRIGREIAHRVAAFGVAVAYHNRRPLAKLPYRYCASLSALAQTCDVLIVAVPATAQTRRAISADILAALGSNGILVNVSRGSVVDEAALIAALRNGVILAAGLDVFEHEPAPDPAFAALPNTVLLPHVGSASLPTR